MTRHTSAFCFCALAMLLVSGLAAQSAFGLTNGTTAFTCSSSATVKDYKTEHCTPGESGTAYGHVAIAENTKTEVTISNEKTNAETNGSTPVVLKSTIAGSAIELVASGASGTGTMENKKETSGEHFIHAETSTKYTGVKEKNLGCKVTGKPGGAETIETKPLTMTTAGVEGAGKLAPKEGTLFAEFELTECILGPITIKVIGSVTCKPSGATVVCGHEEVTSSKTLRLQSATGPVVGVEVKTTFKGRANGSESYTPLSPTIKGTTAFTCRADAAVKDFKTEHCVPGETGTAYGHVAIAENTKTEVTISNEKTNPETNGSTSAILKSTIGGSPIELVATGASGTGTMENRQSLGNEHFIQAETSTKYTGVKEKTLGCKVTGKPGGAETIETKPLVTTTAGQGDAGKLTPKEGTVFAEFELTECILGPITIKVIGSVTCKPSGATVVCGHEEVTSSKTLRLQSAVGPVAGVEVKTTFKGRANGSESYTPLGPTTVATP